MTPFRAGLLLVIGILSVAAMIGFLFFANIELTSPVSAGTSPTRIIDSPTDTEARATLQAAVDFVTSVAKGTPQNGQTPTAPASTPVAIGQSFTLNGTLYTVNQVADPEPPGFFKPAAGKRFVAVELTQTAVSAAGAYSIGFFSLRGDDGNDYTWANGNNKPSLGTGQLKVGESASGWVTIAMPASVKPVAVLVSPPAGKKTVITTLP